MNLIISTDLADNFSKYESLPIKAISKVKNKEKNEKLIACFDTWKNIWAQQVIDI